MSIAIDLLVLSDAEVTVLQSTLDVEAVDQELITLWQFTNFAIEELAERWRVPSTLPAPLCADASGFLAFEWGPELVEKLATLDETGFADLVQHFQGSEFLTGVEPAVVRAGAATLRQACRRAVSEGRRVVQVDSI